MGQVTETKDRRRDEYAGAIDDLLRELFGTYLRPKTPPVREMNVTLGQMECLRAIGELGNPTMSEVAKALGLPASNVTVLVDGLVAHGLASRRADSKDRRIVRVAETRKGRENHERHMAAMRARLLDLLSDLSDDELAGIHGSLAALVEAARRHTEGEKTKSAPRPRRRGKGR